MLTTRISPGGRSSRVARMCCWTTASRRWSHEPGWSYWSCQETQFLPTSMPITRPYAGTAGRHQCGDYALGRRPVGPHEIDVPLGHLDAARQHPVDAARADDRDRRRESQDDKLRVELRHRR